jgi:hypothetical protein
MYRPENVDAAVQAVWESAPGDEALQNMGPHEFWNYLKGWDLTDEESTFAYMEFEERVDRVFAQGAY